MTVSQIAAHIKFADMGAVGRCVCVTFTLYSGTELNTERFSSFKMYVDVGRFFIL